VPRPRERQAGPSPALCAHPWKTVGARAAGRLGRHLLGRLTSGEPRRRCAPLRPPASAPRSTRSGPTSRR
jgi:hypothetical protein